MDNEELFIDENIFTDEEILSEILDINIHDIAKAAIEVLGENYRDKVIDTLNDIAFYGYGSIANVVCCLQKKILVLTDRLDKLPIKDQEQSPIKAKIERLNDIYYLLISKQIKIEKNNAITNELITSKIDYCKHNLSPATLERLKRDLPSQQALKTLIKSGYVLTNIYDTSKEKDYYNHRFQILLNCSDINEMESHPDYKLICKCSEDASTILEEQKKFTIKNTPTIRASIERLRNMGVVNGLSDEDIYDMFFVKEKYIQGQSSARYGRLGKTIHVVGIKLDNLTDDQVIIHEIIHALTQKILIDGQFICGFLNCDFKWGYRYVNEIVTDWLAELITKVYLSKFVPMFGITYPSPSGYTLCYKLVSNFLENYKDEIVAAITSDNPIQFLDSIGREYFDKADEIFEIAIRSGQVSSKDIEFLKYFNNLEKQLN